MEEIYIVTGASGHLGNVVARMLVERDHRVWIFLLEKEKNVVEGVEKIYYGDVCQAESLTPMFEDARGKKVNLIHCAGIVSIKSRYSSKLCDVNVGGTRNIVDLCLTHGVQKLVYVSSVHAIPDNAHGEVIFETDRFSARTVSGHYAKSKAAATAYVLEAGKRGLNVSVVHPSGIIGPYDYGSGHMTTLILDYCRGRLKAGMSGGYDFVDVRDVAEGILSCCQKGEEGECYLLTNRYYSIRELMDMLQEITGRRKLRVYFPRWVADAVAPLAEMYYRILKQAPLYTRYSIETLSADNHYSHEKADQVLGYGNRPMKDTLKDTYEWLLKMGRIQ